MYARGRAGDESLLASGTRADDASEHVTAGFRADWTTRPGALTMEGAFTAGRSRALWPNLDPQTAAVHPIRDDPSTTQGGHLLGRWTRKRPGGASLQLQSFVDVRPGRSRSVTTAAACSTWTRSTSSPSARHDLVAGGGYRFIAERFAGGVGFSLTPPEDSSSLFSAFLQDEIALFGNRLAVTLGTQVQYDSDAGAGLQPTARVLWKVRPRQRVWAAVSRALRTPSLADRGLQLEFPPVATAAGLPLVVTTRGNPDAETETFVDVEAGYRVEIGTTASIDVTGFMGRYEHLAMQEQLAPVVRFVPSPQLLVVSQFGNQLEATTRGLEVAGHWAPVPAWRLDGSYTAFHLTPHRPAASLDPSAASDDGSATKGQWQLRSVLFPGSRATVSIALFHVGALEQLQVAAYTRADISAEWRFNRSLSAMAIGQNLFDAAHAEFGGAGTLLTSTQVPRSASLQLRWTFR